ncbi:streptomycin biosynthesis enzyme StrG [Microbulbifer sp. A4B17]|uniref:streptomycin biosynthesis enzyme StrG n=1 Tax=Microbulbifer sp. A4B17 TaxID=359370 RepID=UPI000D52C303|nr:streptomycin biosynthesis enzyme StrG [Microbulbifer sp. A4B17]AWF80532.1 streptomycin biosynthesis enzyme StrG [Microbulbifer sp. A4B17]
MIIVRYDVNQYPFQRVLSSSVFKVPNLHKLHEVWKKQSGKQVLTYKDNIVLRELMQRLPDNSLFYQIYHTWVANVIAPHFNRKISYSAHPKMRVHLSGTGCVSGFHRDVDITKQYDQINCYLPFTNVFEGCTVWCETDYGTDQYKPLNLRYGEALLWDGGMLKHGSKENDTGHTRISCDFRFSPKKPDLVASPWSDILSSRPKLQCTNNQIK